MPYLKTGKGRFFYRVKGKGPALLILQGLGRSTRHWENFESRLSESASVISCDYRGIGRTSKHLSWLDTMQDLAEDIKLLLDHLEVDRIHIFGLSLGGMLALSFARHHPDRVKSLVVANSSIGGGGKLRIYPQVIAAMALGTLRPNSLHPLMTYFCTCKYTPAKTRTSFMKKWKKIDEKEQPARLSIAKQLLLAVRFGKHVGLHKIKAPSLIVYSSLDRFVPTSNSKVIFNQLSNSILHELSDAGHEILPDSQTELIELIGRFINKHDGGNLPS